jgi:hypothetical protein
VANLIYPKGKEKLEDALIDLPTDTIKLALVGAGYVFNTTHEFYSDVTPASNVIGTPVTLAGKSITNGKFSATSPVVFTAVTGAQVTRVLVYKDTGVQSTSPLICIFDTATGLPVTPNGGDINFLIDAVNGIFTL